MGQRNKKGDWSISMVMKLALLGVVVVIISLVASKLPGLSKKTITFKELPCVETGKTSDESEVALFDYTQKGIGKKEEMVMICKSFESCFPESYSKYKAECRGLTT